MIIKLQIQALQLSNNMILLSIIIAEEILCCKIDKTGSGNLFQSLCR